MSKIHPEQLEITSPLGGIDNQTDFVKAQVVADLSAFEQAVSGISSFPLKPKKMAG